MEFRLIYEGSLKSGNKPRVSEKHAIRKQIHKQLAELWKTHPTLIKMNTSVRPQKGAEPSDYRDINNIISRGGHGNIGLTFVETMAKKHDRCNFHFVPLVNEDLKLVCALDILFLRRETPGELLKQGGDIDNRIKTLFDALKVPKNCNELGEAKPEPDEEPFFCLLEDDGLVTGLNVTTDQLLTPLKPDQHGNEVVLIIKVQVKILQISIENLALF